jgi:hypothetical protein
MATKKTAGKTAGKTASKKRQRPRAAKTAAAKTVAAKKALGQSVADQKRKAKLRAAAASGEIRGSGSYVHGERRDKLQAVAVVFCEKPKTFAQIGTKLRTTESQTRYFVRALVARGILLKSGWRQDTVYKTVEGSW